MSENVKITVRGIDGKSMGMVLIEIRERKIFVSTSLENEFASTYDLPRPPRDSNFLHRGEQGRE